MSESVPTVMIVNDKDTETFLIINESDFDPATMTLWADRDKPKAKVEAKAEPKAPAAAPPSAPMREPAGSHAPKKE